MTVFTIGYEGLNIEDFEALLRDSGIETVVDVRELPLSRKPGFSKKSLSQFLCEAGIGYVHMADLGCPKNVRDRYRTDGNWQRYTEGFLKHLTAQSKAITELSKVTKTSTCALLCYEADYNYCHRSMVANAVRENSGAKVRHLQATTTKKAMPAKPKLASAWAGRTN